MTTQTQERIAIRMLAERYGEAWNSQDLDAIMDLHTDYLDSLAMQRQLGGE